MASRTSQESAGTIRGKYILPHSPLLEIHLMLKTKGRIISERIGKIREEKYKTEGETMPDNVRQVSKHQK